MMIQFNQRAWEVFKTNPEMGFNELSLAVKDLHNDTIILAQYLVFVGMKAYADRYIVPLQKMPDVLYSLADSVKGYTGAVNTEPIVSACGGCGGGRVL
jgi:hypothetical protein